MKVTKKCDNHGSRPSWPLYIPLVGGVTERTAPFQREFFIDNLLVQIHLIIEMILVDRPYTMGV
jgi:hypothetical protein